MDIENLLKKSKILPNALRDQFFLTDNSVVERMVEIAKVNKKDVVLEIGAGVGNLTRALADRAKKVISFEIDERFKPLLVGLPRNVELHFGNAWDYVQLHGKFWKTKEYNKIVSNLPYSLCEPVLHNLTFLRYDKVVLLVPKKFADKIETNPIFGSFFSVKECLEVPKEKFYPSPNTQSVVIELVHLPDPIKNENAPLFLRQYLYQHEDQKVKNSLREGLIEYSRRADGRKLTKRQAQEIIRGSGINEELLKEGPGKYIYKEVSAKLSTIW